jgi:hypothetical protein
MCPLCGGPAAYDQHLGTTATTGYDCKRCRRFRISDQVIKRVLTPKPGYKPPLSAFCRRLPEGTEPPIITTDTVEQIIRDVPQYTPPEKLDTLLELLGKMTPALGRPTTFDPTRDYPLLIARDPAEVQFLLLELADLDLLSLRPLRTLRLCVKLLFAVSHHLGENVHRDGERDRQANR